jgi:DNA-binding transcriptional ArsR family regulator
MTFAVYSDDQLAKALDALSNPVRLSIARALTEPRCLSEIGIAPTANPRGLGVRGNILARQTVKQHLDRLADAGIIITRKAQRDHGETTEYLLNPDSLLVISEAFQELTRFLAGQEGTFDRARRTLMSTVPPILA